MDPALSEPFVQSLSANAAPVYRCPGEPDSISCGVHLSRLASFYHKCRHCEHRGDIARLAPRIQQQWQTLLESADLPSLFTRQGIRGLALNQMTRQEATQVAAAYAATLKEVLDLWRTKHPSPASRWMRVVFGHDGRPSSPELAIAAASTLRQHGCELIDIGWSTRPQLELVLKSKTADGAFFVTGHGAPVGWNGFDLLGPDGIVWSGGGVLERVSQRFQQSCPRPEREAAPLSAYDANKDSLRNLCQSLHGLRPLHVEIHAEDQTTLALLTASRPHWPGGLTLKSGDGGGDIRFHIGEDSRQCDVLNEAGQTVSEERLLFALGELLLDEHPHVDVVLTDACFERHGWMVERCGPGYLVFHRGGETEEQLQRTMISFNAPLACDGEGRYWIRHEGHIRCDALLTMAMTLRSLSRTDGTASEWSRQPRS